VDVVWEAVGEVSGTVVYRHPELQRGAILPAGTELLRIDPTDYRHAVAEIEANIRAADSQLALLDVRAVNTKRSLAIEERNLALARKQFERTRELLRRGAVSRSDADREERSVLAGEQAVRHETGLLLSSLPRCGHIVNLGHGVLPETPLQAVQALVEAVHAEAERDV